MVVSAPWPGYTAVSAGSDSSLAGDALDDLAELGGARGLAGAAGEERVAGEEMPRHEQADAAGRVAGGEEHLEGEVADGNDVSVLQVVVGR